MKNKYSKTDLRLGKIKQEKKKVDLKEDDVLKELSDAGETHARKQTCTKRKAFT